MTVSLTLADISVFNGEPTIVDLRLASLLGYEDVHKIRDLIKRNIEELMGYGEVSATVAETSPLGGRPSIEYHLNEGQALAVSALSKTKMAAAIRKMLIDVFMAWRRGSLVEAEAEEGVPFFDPVNAHAPLGSRVAAVAQVGRRYGRAAEAVAMRLYRLGDFAAVTQAHKVERGRECLAHLLAARIDDGLTVREHIQVAYAADDSTHAPLWNHGIRAIVGPPSGILVATKAELLQGIYAGTEWAGGRHSAALRSLAGAHPDRTQKFAGGAQSSTVFLPIGLMTAIP